MKKAQSSLEYLMTYGWAILILVVALAIIVYVGLVDPQSNAPNSLVLPSGFSAYSYGVRGNRLMLDLGQATGKTITVTGIVCTQNETASEVTNLNVQIPSGQHRMVTDYDSNFTCTCPGATPGALYKGFVFLWYDRPNSNVPHMVQGELTYYVEYDVS